MPNLTTNQKAIVDHASGNLLVSAGAGSGKTFVLTEHVINRITASENPSPIDRLLIVTFTKAAAAEMRERIGNAISVELKKRPEDAGLRSQQALLSRAQICTIDSFCGSIVKNYFHSIDRDSDYRIADSGELSLLSVDVYKKVLETHYSKKEPEFYELIDNYTNGKGDDSLYSIILTFCEKANVCPDPRKYLTELTLSTQKPCDNIEDIEVLKVYAKQIRSDAREASEIILDWKDSLTGTNFENTVEPDLSALEGIISTKGVSDLLELLRAGLKWGRKRSKSAKNPDTEIDVAYGAIHEDIKENFKKIIKNLGKVSPGDILLITNYASKPLSLVSKLALEYYDAFRAEKDERNIVDFADVEHMALDIITQDEKAKAEIAGSFDEIMIDEYQDSNDLQEAILSGISNGSNMFMVGDVKQSIYAFRNAKPKLFTDKYELFSVQPGLGQKIDLQENFRCRKEVINGVNEVFNRIMTKDFGHVDYKRTAQLIYGADYPKSDYSDYKPELLHLGKVKIRDEAKAVALRIKEMMGEAGLHVRANKNSNELRPLRYGDIGILCRKTSDFDIIRKELLSFGIPALLQRSKGYFDSQEVNLIIDILSIIDNPRQDIPLVAVLGSVIGGFSPDELAEIRGSDPGCSLYESMVSSDSSKAKAFVSMLSKYRELSVHVSINELIERITDDTGFMYYAAALPGGPVRKVNIEMLKEMARTYENTSYHGLFDFIRYIRQIKLNEADTESAQVLSESEDAVKIMTVHSSKGLEFPVVILMDNDAKGKTDNDRIFLSSNYGLSTDYYNGAKSLKVPSPVKTVSKVLSAEKEMEEVSRLLYVAMTRAREKLIVTYTGEDLPETEGDKPAFELRNCRTFSDLIAAGLSGSPKAWKIVSIDGAETYKHLIKSDVTEFINKKELELSDENDISDEILRKELDRKLGFVYKFEKVSGMKSAYSVSELKKLHDSIDPEFEDDMERRQRPSFAGGSKESALLGSAYHLIFEKVDPFKATDENYIQNLISEYKDRGLIESEIAHMMDTFAITNFYKTEIGQKALKAHNEGRLFREKAFVLGDFEDVSLTGLTDDDRIIIQGVIDMYFFDGDGIILVDYKSDYIKPGEEELLAKRYEAQLGYYSKAIEKATGKYPEKRYLYSIRTGRFIDA